MNLLPKYWPIGVAIVALLGVLSFAGLLAAGVFNAPPPAPVNPLCTSAAATQLNDYWQVQIANAGVANVQAVIAQAEAATVARMNLCTG
jgi:hypothetical protein